MRHWERLLVAMTAVIAIAFSSAVGLTLYQLWRHPPQIQVDKVSNGVILRGAQYNAELTLTGGAFEQLVIWRSLPGFGENARQGG